MEIETIKSNKLIAEFMGYTKGTTDHGKNGKHEAWFNDSIHKGHYKSPIEFHYNISWDELIPVVQKINSIEYLRSDMEIRFSSSPMCVLRTRTEDNHWDVLVCKDSEGLETVYATVLEFIKWYNINK
jgi:hypothetical protein